MGTISLGLSQDMIVPMADCDISPPITIEISEPEQRTTPSMEQKSELTAVELNKEVKCKEDILKRTKRTKDFVSSSQIGLVLSSVAETHPKIYPSRCNLQFSICRHAGRKVLSLDNHYCVF